MFLERSTGFWNTDRYTTIATGYVKTVVTELSVDPTTVYQIDIENSEVITESIAYDYTICATV